MTCQVYKDSAESAKKSLIHALEENEDLGILSDLYNHYVGLREIAEKHTHVDNIVINTDDYSGYPYGVELGQPVTLGLGTEDTITFADTDGVMNIEYPTQGFGINDDISFSTSSDTVTIPEDIKVD